MGRTVGVFAVLAVLVVLLPGTARADGDVVILDTGMVLEGTILSRNEKVLRMDVDGLGKMDVPLGTIKTINGEDPRAAGKTPEPSEPVPGKDPQPEPEPEPAKPVSRTDVHYDEMKPGQVLLFILAGENHGEWLETGPRVVAELGRIGKRRFKLIVDPAAGVLGEKWVKKEDLIRAVRLDGHAERRLLFFSEGVESGSWIRGVTVSGESFEGQLGGVTREGTVTMWRPDGDRVVKAEVALQELKSLRAVTRSKALDKRIEELADGEPVEFVVKGRDAPVAGRVVRADQQWITVSDGQTETHLFRGLPVTGLKTLPDSLRHGLAGIGENGWLTVSVKIEDEEAVTRRDVTGRCHAATLNDLTLVTADGEETISVATVESAVATDAERISTLTARKSASTAETMLPVLPGMSREEVEKRIPVGVEGIDIMWEEDRVATVYVRPPFPGPVFGIRFDDPLAKALTQTDLVFDTQITPKDSDEVVTMVSRTLTTYEVRLLVAKSGAILAAEVSAR